jgi:polyhydroxyalkanoate synthesis regulator phasin
MAKHGIDTADQLKAHQDGLTAQIAALSGERKRLRNQARSIRDEEKRAAVRTEISALSAQITELRREVRLCENIESRSAKMGEKLRAAAADAKTKSMTKDVNRDEPFRRRR